MTDDSRKPGETPEDLAQRLRNKYLKMGQRSLADPSPTRLSLQERERMRKILGIDPGDVRIHTGEAASEAATAMQAKAFTLGSDEVYFREDAYQPNTQEGDALLAHELTHVSEDTAGFSLDSSGSVAGEAAAEGRAERKEDVARAMARGGGSPALTSADKDELVRKVTRILGRQQSSSKDRRGH